LRHGAKAVRIETPGDSLDAFPAPEPSGHEHKVSTGDGAGIDALPISKRMMDLIRRIDDPEATNRGEVAVARGPRGLEGLGRLREDVHRSHCQPGIAVLDNRNGQTPPNKTGTGRVYCC
jgi:hypothetical protein